jgi:hypothetical protein
MSPVSINVPDSILRKARELAERNGVSLDQFVSSAIGEKVTALLTVDYLKQRAAKSSLEEFPANSVRSA